MLEFRALTTIGHLTLSHSLTLSFQVRMNLDRSSMVRRVMQTLGGEFYGRLAKTQSFAIQFEWLDSREIPKVAKLDKPFAQSEKSFEKQFWPVAAIELPDLVNHFNNQTKNSNANDAGEALRTVSTEKLTGESRNQQRNQLRNRLI